MAVFTWRRGGALAFSFLLAGGLIAAEQSPGDAAIEGFSSNGAATEVQLERRFDADVSAAEERDWLEKLTAAPNHVGSPHDKANAEFILAKFREWGWDASIETFQVLYPTPRELRLELTAPTHYVAKLREPPISGDRTSTQTRDELPPYNVYGADGDVSGELVYVNHGMPDDYRELARQGISVKGRIVLVRYGGGWRGLKPKLAYEHGAIGCLIYSDPADDGYGKGDIYPAGGYRPADAVQRGSVQDILQYTGDPLTPGVGSTPDTKRLAIADAKTILKIPVLPISYADATPLLAALGGPVAPASWRGGLPFAYHIGPGAAQVHLKIVSDWSQKTLYDVIAKLTGSVEPDRWIIRGNHHDGWVFGAADPLSGTVAQLSEAKAIGQLVKAGWRPRRTLIYASWDGEEPGLIGSTEWAETHAAELQAKAALYVNTDNNERGFFRAEGTHALQLFVSEAARDVKDPETDASVLRRALAERRVRAFESGRDAPGHDSDGGGDELHLGPLGSGSDYTPFLQHLGVTSLDLGFSGESQYGVYHSAYDNFYWYSHFEDPDFAYGRALSQVTATVTMRLADAPVLPFDFNRVAVSVTAWLDEIAKISGGQKVNLEAARKANARLARAADAFGKRSPAAPGKRAAIDRILINCEHDLTLDPGLPGRPWYRHRLYAPGRYTGYAVKTLPGIREALEANQPDEAAEQTKQLAQVLNTLADHINEARKL